MSNKLLLLIAVTAIGILVIPETISLFSGQHNFYDTMQNGNQVPCEKCHSDVYNELSQPGTVNLVHKIMGCEQCHITAAPNSEGNFQRIQFHAATTASCIDCHNSTLLYGTFDHSAAIPYMQSGQIGCLTCHQNPQSLPGNFSAVNIFTGSAEAHKYFANGAKNSLLLKDANEACISCHTHIKVNIVWTKVTTLSLDVGINNNKWNITNITGKDKNITITTG